GAPLGGHDPYSASKAAAEILVASYERTYFRERGIPVATARGGNVIGGGDFSEDRIVPDVFRAMQVGQPIMLRNPGATRPWQHVLDCLTGYLAFTQALVTVPNTPRAMNFG
ncbi:MAG: NAD-dependent epimerase/dehydratase family protein, partial [Alphaproteobacteria bacterium]